MIIIKIFINNSLYIHSTSKKFEITDEKVD